MGGPPAQACGSKEARWVGRGVYSMADAMPLRGCGGDGWERFARTRTIAHFSEDEAAAEMGHPELGLVLCPG